MSYLYFSEGVTFYQSFDLRGLIGDLKESSIPQDFCTIGGRRQISFKTDFPRLQANNQIRVLSEIFYLIHLF